MKTSRHKTAVHRVKKRTTRVTVDFPEAQHRKLKAIAALEGSTLQDYIRSRVIPEIEGNDVSDSELTPIVKKIINEDKDILKRLANK